MTLTLIWILSFVAAGALFLSGFLFGRRTSPVDLMEPVNPGAQFPLSDEVERLNGLLQKKTADHRSERNQAAEALASLRESKEEVERLRAELMRRDSRSDNPRPQLPSSSTRSVLPLSEDAGPLDESIKSIARRPGHRSVVVADELGFPIVGFGDDQEPLAALCGVINEVDTRARQLLETGPARRVTLETEKGLTISACSGTYEGVPLTLATTTDGPSLDTHALRSALDEFRKTLNSGGYRLSQGETLS